MIFFFFFSYIDVSAGLAIEQACATFFVFTLSMIFLRERPSWRKALAVSICVAGIFVIGFSDRPSDSPSSSSSSSSSASSSASSSSTPTVKAPVYRPWIGVLCGMGAALTSAGLMIATKRVLSGLRDFSSVVVLLSSIGSCIFIFCWPVFIVAHFALGSEALGFPSSSSARSILALICFLMVTFNLCFYLTVFIASPLFARVMTTSNIPVTFVVALALGEKANPVKMVGGFVVSLGIVAFSLAQEYDRRVILKRAMSGGIPIEIDQNNHHQHQSNIDVLTKGPRMQSAVLKTEKAPLLDDTATA